MLHQLAAACGCTFEDMLARGAQIFRSGQQPNDYQAKVAENLPAAWRAIYARWLSVLVERLPSADLRVVSPDGVAAHVVDLSTRQARPGTPCMVFPSGDGKPVLGLVHRLAAGGRVAVDVAIPSHVIEEPFEVGHIICSWHPREGVLP